MIYNRRRCLCWLAGSAAIVFLVTVIATSSVDKKVRGKNYRRKEGVSRDDILNGKDVAKVIRSDKKQTEYIDKRGVHVVVGKYVGSKLDAAGAPNFTRAELDANNYSPDPSAGADGEAVFLGTAEKIRSKRLWHLNKFNLVVSDKIPLNRTLKDVRKSACAQREYRLEGLPVASVVIVFHNEAWSTLLRTVQSVIDRSPRQLLKEILLVDDASDRAFLREPLESHLESLKVPSRVLRSSKRVGLIQARLRGAAETKGDAIVFLDAHCEVTAGWLEPLLDRLAESRAAIVSPVIDIINDETFAYTKSFSLHWGAFNWEMHFRWFTMSNSVMEEYKKDTTKPYRTPVMAGGLFAIDRKYFYELGSYDKQMDIWGGENLEMSFRAWMCGGSVEIAPCSHVGHIFRKASPYSFPREGGVGSVLHANLARVALVWMDDMAKFYFKINPQVKAAAEGQDVSSRRQLRRHLKCRDFSWYLRTVWPEHFFPTQGRRLGSLRLLDTDLCVQTPRRDLNAGSNQPSGAAILEECAAADFYTPQLLVVTEHEKNVTGRLVMADESVCLDAPAAGQADQATVRFQACTGEGRQRWRVNEGNLSVVHAESGQCLTRPDGGTSDALVVQECREDGPGQQWHLDDRRWREPSGAAVSNDDIL